jgi:hypothetical protein
MCAGCISSKSSGSYSKDFDNKPFLPTRNGSMGDNGIAIKNSTRFDGTGDQDEKFEGQHPGKSAGAKQMENSGHD